MRRWLPTLLVAAFLPAGAVAQPGPASVPKAFGDYLQRDITPGLCKVVSPSEAQCVIPEMTAGQYAIEAAGTSTSQGADARQTLQINVGVVGCATGQNTTPWPSGARTFRLGCAVILLTDKPLIVRVVYDDVHAIKDPKGPLLSIRRLPWQGVLNSSAYVPQQ
jgi:hypothetical protein